MCKICFVFNKQRKTEKRREGEKDLTKKHDLKRCQS